MSLDCYPFGKRRTIALREQPIALDVAYDDNLLVVVVNSCQRVVIYNLNEDHDMQPGCKRTDDNENGENGVIGYFSLGDDVVIDRVAYCKRGDYIACVGHKNGAPALYVAFGWRSSGPGHVTQDDSGNFIIEELKLASLVVPFDEIERGNKLGSIDMCQKTGNLAASYGDLVVIYRYVEDEDEDEDDDEDDDGCIQAQLDCRLSHHTNMGCQGCSARDEGRFCCHRFKHIVSVKLTMLALEVRLIENFLSVMAADHVQVLKLELKQPCSSLDSPGAAALCPGDDCITWNLNTKKLVKLPTLMQDTSSDLSSFHICHPLELLGPASESIACRVKARVYSPDLAQNQLEPVVLLCKQFDSDRDPVKSTHLQAVYLSSLNTESSSLGQQQGRQQSEPIVESRHHGARRGTCGSLLKSADHELLSSVGCFVATLTQCSVYSLTGKKVSRLQTITHPDLCLDLRPDLLQCFLLTPLGLLICSTGLCDSALRYEWSSSADLSLSFVACDRVRVLTSADYIVMVSSSPSPPSGPGLFDEAKPIASACFVEFMAKPRLADLFARVVHIINRCQSISVRSNLLTYLHASAQLALVGQVSGEWHQQKEEPVLMLREITTLLCKQLLQKKQTNMITNGRIDRAIKHLLDISHCDLGELMSRHLDSQRERTVAPSRAATAAYGRSSCDVENDSDKDNDDNDDNADNDVGGGGGSGEQLVDYDYELLRIYLRHSKFSQSILTYLFSNSNDELTSSRIVAYMFDNNPRLLIKCAQRFTKELGLCQGAAGPASVDRQPPCAGLLVDKLKQLLELNSTGINRATVLFTLATLHLAAKDRTQCLGALAQIKPLNHLAITMCSNHEIIGEPMARLVQQTYPEVFGLFLAQLAKRGSDLARPFALLSAGLAEPGGDQQQSQVAGEGQGEERLQKEAEEEGTEEDTQARQKDEDELFEERLRLVAELSPCELADLLGELVARNRLESGQGAELAEEEAAAVEAYMRASINLLESRFILGRLCENSR